ncbi:MAG: deoxyribodipyrimidine photolyase [Thermoguttaceae bacterium]|nr:deoxyribodipyrimidine photolyase [Thermoguttaceae bacterium]
MSSFSSVPADRVRVANDGRVAGDGRYVLYWAGAYRRTEWNFALDRAVDWARRLKRPLLVAETLRAGCRWASRRHHEYVLQGMVDNATLCREAGIGYYPFLAPDPSAEIDFVSELAKAAAVVIGDDYPIRELTDALASVARKATARLEAIDSNGLMPIRRSKRLFTTARSFRQFLQRELPDQLPTMPLARPLTGVRFPQLGPLPGPIGRRWQAASEAIRSSCAAAGLSIDEQVTPVSRRGGTLAARERLRRFVQRTLPRYAEERNQPEADATSGLSPDLHFGHLSVHEIFHTVAASQDWSPGRLAERPTGTREEWWGMSATAEAFLDELITWRELGFNYCVQREDYDRFESLPDWARKTLAEHAADPRPHLYSLEQLERAETHDTLWNAAQRQLVREGRIHNYLRMLWGKKILEWSASPEAALEAMIELNNKYALDGQDPNSYSGIFWVLGRYDRPWGPIRPIFGTVRYMSSANTMRKVPVKEYLRTYAPESE